MPRALEQKLENPREVTKESFDNWDDENWSYTDGIKTTNGSDKFVEIPGVTPWQSQLASPPFGPNQGVYISFKLANPPNGVQFFATQNDWDTSAYKRFGGGLYEQGHMVTTIFTGTQQPSASGQDLDRSLQFLPGSWYGIFIGADDNGRFHLITWNWEGSPHAVWTDYQGPADWKTGEWAFIVEVDNGTVLVNDFVVVEFNGFK